MKKRPEPLPHEVMLRFIRQNVSPNGKRVTLKQVNRFLAAFSTLRCCRRRGSPTRGTHGCWLDYAICQYPGKVQICAGLSPWDALAKWLDMDRMKLAGLCRSLLEQRAQDEHRRPMAKTEKEVLYYV